MDNSTPLYQEIYDDLLKKIDTGYYSEKTVLPSISGGYGTKLP